MSVWPNVVTAVGTLAGAVVGATLTARFVHLDRIGQLLEKRYTPYANVLKEMRPYADAAGNPVFVAIDERRKTAEALTKWFYDEGGGVLMSGNALNKWLAARSKLLEDNAKPDEVFKALSEFRTELKIDLGVRHPAERDVPFAESAEQQRLPRPPALP